MAPQPDVKKPNRRPVGAGLSLDKFAALGVSKFDKRKKLERLQKQKVIQHSKLTKLKKKLESQGVLTGFQVKDSVAELEALDGIGSSKGADDDDHRQSAQERLDSHAQAGPGHQHGSAPNRQQKAAPFRAQPSKAPTGQHVQGEQPGGHREGGRDGGGPKEAAGRKRPHPDGSEAAPWQPHGRRKQPQDAAPSHGGRGGHARRDEGQGRDGSDDEAPAPGGAQGAQGGTRKDARRPGAGGSDSRGQQQGGKKLSQLQRLAQRVAEEKAEAQRAKEAAMKEREERLKRVAAVEKARKEEKQLYFKRTAKGQPLMRYRMDKLLSKLEHEAK